MATGCLSSANVPAIPGRDDFGGRTFHTGRWPHEGVDFTGRRVAVIGTGSSGVQSIPLIAEQADQVVVFQRTPSYAVPAHNEPLDPEQVAAIKADYVEWRKTARDTSTGFGGHMARLDRSAMDVSATPVEQITEMAVVVDGVHHDVDDIVFATGFDAMTGSLDRIDITGRGGRTLRDAWSAGPTTLLGLQVAGFPNLFTVTGPGSPSVLTNMVVSIEQHVEYIRDVISSLDAEGLSTIEATEEAQAEWVAWVNTVAGLTLFHGCSSWYLGANVPGKPRVFMPLPGFVDYKTHCDAVAAEGYPGFVRA
ncbi:MAG: NAD(P)/FAD-dependent oxidoreductase [Actinobacteria bacterium]|nr:NAD(P)/FAD-dependent oxidoreductase [Actinomycetota bacterium]